MWMPGAYGTPLAEGRTQMAGKKKQAKGPVKPKAAKDGKAPALKAGMKAGPKTQDPKKQEKKGGESDKKPKADLAACIPCKMTIPTLQLGAFPLLYVGRTGRSQRGDGRHGRP